MKFSEINIPLFLFVDKIVIKLNKMLKLWRIDFKKYYIINKYTKI